MSVSISKRNLCVKLIHAVKVLIVLIVFSNDIGDGGLGQE